MKTTNKILAMIAAGFMLLSVVSCKKSFYTDANKNPNAPASVPSGDLLSTVEVGLAYTQGGASSQFTCLFTQQCVGNQRQSASYYSYIITPADPEYLWDQMYTYVMENDYTLMNQAKSMGQNEYYGIANIIMAYSIQVNVDYWGKMPYSTALQGAANLQPTYDNDQTLYATALQLLNTGITYLNNPSKGTQYPTSDDVIYGGNAIQWIQFANAIKARLFIHQCKHGNPAYEDSAIACVNNTNALTGSYTNAEVYFGSAATNNGPWFQFNNQRVGYIAFTGSTLIDSMQAMNDPRDSIYVNFGNGSLGNFYGLGTSPVEFITAEELDLIAAEANERLTNPAAAQTAYTAALNASMTKLNVPATEAATYIVAQGTLPVTQAAALHQIGVQAWIALYLNPEAWTTWRRLNAPVLSPIAGTEIIRRMIYPNSEVTLNPNCPPGVTIFQPQIFWDN
jgi:hypothetical protein